MTARPTTADHHLRAISEAGSASSFRGRDEPVPTPDVTQETTT